MNQVSCSNTTKENASMDWLNLLRMSRMREAFGTRMVKSF